MSQVSERVGTESTGSTNAVETSGEQQHVALVDRLKASDGRPIEAQALPDHGLVQGGAGIEKCCQVPGRSQNFTSTT